jgi:hypothetical protein
MKKTIFLVTLLLTGLITSCNDKQESSSEENTNVQVELNVEEAIKVNSYDLIKEFQEDRSIAYEKYSNKTLLITDLLVEDIFIPNESFSKQIEARPYNPKSNLGTFGNSYYTYMYNDQEITNTEIEGVINFEIGNEQLKKAKLLGYEGIENKIYTKKIDVYGVISDFGYNVNTNRTNNISTRNFNLILSGVQIK